MAKETDKTVEKAVTPPEQSAITMSKAELDAYLEAYIAKTREAEKLEAQNTVSEAEAITKREEAWLEEYVEVKLFKDGKDYKDDVFVAVGGYGIQIKRGVPVKIKRKFALILDQAQMQDIRAAQLSEKMETDYMSESKKYGIN